MNLWQHRYRAWIVPYAEETLDARRRAELEAWLAHDPVLAAEAEAERRVVTRLRAAAQSSEGATGEKNLWPGIQARLAPRRSPVRPLLLVGGLSAAATSLAWAALWGPLHHPAPPMPLPAQTLSANAPGVIVVEVPPGRSHSRLGHRPRHSGGHTAKRLTAPVAGSGNEAGRTGTPDAARMAHLDTPLSAEISGAQTAPASPGNPDRFHLATNVRPLGHSDDVENATPEQGGAAPLASENAKAPGAAVNSRSPDPLDGAAVAAPTAGPERVKSQQTVEHHAHRRHSRRTHRLDTATPAVDNGTRTAPGTDIVAPAAHAPSRPKSAPKPVD